MLIYNGIHMLKAKAFIKVLGFLDVDKFDGLL